MNRLFLIKLVHSVIFWWQVLCLAYLLFAGITGTFNIPVLIAVISIFINGFLLMVNNGRCPFTTLAGNQGAKSGSVTNLFLPDCFARNTFRVSFPLFFCELVLLAVRYFTGS